MTKETKDVTLDDATAALGQMANFFKAFRRVDDLVQFLRTAEQRKAEIEAEVAALEKGRDAFAAQLAGEQAQLAEALTEANRKISAARARLAKIEAEEKQSEAAAALAAEKRAEDATEQAREAAAAQAVAEAELQATREAEAEAQVRLDEIRAKIAGIAAVSAV
jgi:chromosome segregation ATPase